MLLASPGSGPAGNDQPWPNQAAAGGAELIAFTSSLPDGAQQLIVIDPRRTTVCVYRIEGSTGELALKSVRNIGWDLQMLEFNGVRPLPREIRGLLDRQ